MHKISQAFVPIPEDWFSTKTAKRILRQGKTPEQGAAFHARFLYMIFRAHAIDDDGRVIGSDGLPLDCEDLADEYDRDVEGWESAILAYQALDLVEIDEDGCIRICDYRYWVRRPSDRPEATRERKRRQREREKEQQSEPLKDDVHPRDLRDVTNVTNVTNVTTRTDQIRSEEIRSEETTTEQIRGEESVRGEETEDPLGLPICSSSFFQFVSELHSRVTNKPLSRPERKALDKTLRAPPWSDFTSWRDRAGALLTAELQMRYQLDQGKRFSNAWYYLITAAASHLKQAADVNRANDFAVSKGYKARPHVYEWPAEMEATC